MKHAAVFALALLAGASFAVAASAEELTDLAKQAESEVKDGKNSVPTTPCAKPR